MTIPSILDMLKAGVHFGHKTSRWHPKMKEFIFTDRNGIHIFDLEKTQAQLETVLADLKALAAEGKTILFVTTKPQSKTIVKEAAQKAGMPYLVERWLGGMITNFAEMKKLIGKYNSIKEQEATGELEKYKKKERVRILKELEKMSVTLEGLKDVTKLPDALFVASVQREKTAMVEAEKMNVPVYGICDTNANPRRVQGIIPANDDAIKSIDMIMELVADAIAEGKKEFDSREKTIGKKDDK